MDNVQLEAGLSRSVEASCLGNADGSQDVGLALPIVRTLPVGCIAFEVADAFLEPIVREGDFVAIDVTDRLPVEGAFYLRRTCSEQNARGRTHAARSRNVYLVQARKRRGLRKPSAGWIIGHRPLPGRLMYGDGPYSGLHFSDRIVGRVVAILAEDAPLPFATEPMQTWGSTTCAGAEDWVAL